MKTSIMAGLILAGLAPLAQASQIEAVLQTRKQPCVRVTSKALLMVPSCISHKR